MNMDIPSQINTELTGLNPDAQQLVLDYVRTLNRLGSGMPFSTLEKHIGSIPPDEGQAMRHAIEAGCEQVNLNEW